ncbi:unnamed protein product, partial [Meganyctiphanes norvegica]
MPEYKLIYFNMAARAELARWCFAYGGIEYEDKRIEFEDWPEMKADMPGGQLPVLMVDDKPLPESLAISRYIAKQAGLVPEDDLEAAYCDAIVDTLVALHMTVIEQVMMLKAECEEKKRVMMEEVVPNKINPRLNMLNEKLEDRDWVVSDQTTWADLQIGLLFGMLSEKFPDMLADYPNVSAHVEKVRALEPIAEWISNGPETEII